MLITCPKCSVQYQIPDGVHLASGKKVKCSNCQHTFLFEPKLAEDIDVLEKKEVVAPFFEMEESKVDSTPVFSDVPVFQDDIPQEFSPVEASVSRNKKTGYFLGIIFSLCIVLFLFVLGFCYRDILFSSLTRARNSENYLKSPVATVQSTSIQTQNHVEKKVVPQQAEPLVIEEILNEPTHLIKEDSSRETTEVVPDVFYLPQIHSVRFEIRQEPESAIRIEGMLKNEFDVDIDLPKKLQAVGYDSQGNVLFKKDIYLTESVLPAGEEYSFFGSYQPVVNDVRWIDVTF